MQKLKPYIALVVLALWASCTLGCEVGCLDEIPNDCCYGAGFKLPLTNPPLPVRSNEGECFCSWVKSGGILIVRHSAPVPLPNQLSFDLLAIQASKPVAPSTPVPSDAHSPPPPTGWQFSFRTALPPRAPSFVS